MSLTLYLGPMRCGKTLMVERSQQVCSLDQQVVYINHAADRREEIGGDGFFTTHDKGRQIKLNDKIAKIKANILIEVENHPLFKEWSVVGIDEAFLFPDLVACVRRWLFTYKKTIICCSIDGSYKTEPIGDILKLVPLSTNCIKLNAICDKCRKPNDPSSLVPAHYTMKILSDEEKKGKKVDIEIGASQYLSLCLNHYIEFYESMGPYLQ